MWEIGSTNKQILKDYDWGRDIVNDLGIKQIERMTACSGEYKVSVFPNLCVITVNSRVLHPGIDYGNYLYSISTETRFTMINIVVYKTGIMDVNSGTNKEIESQLNISYKIEALKEKDTDKFVELPEPIYKTVIIRLDDTLTIA